MIQQYVCESYRGERNGQTFISAIKISLNRFFFNYVIIGALTLVKILTIWKWMDIFLYLLQLISSSRQTGSLNQEKFVEIKRNLLDVSSWFLSLKKRAVLHLSVVSYFVSAMCKFYIFRFIAHMHQI